MNTCLNYKSPEIIELAKQVGVEATPAFADKVGTWLDKNSSNITIPKNINTNITDDFTEATEFSSDINKGVKGYSLLRIPVGKKEYSTVYAKDIIITGFENYNFSVYKKNNGDYVIVEKSTGMALPIPVGIDVKSIKSVVEEGQKILEKHGEDKLVKALEEKHIINNDEIISLENNTILPTAEQMTSYLEESSKIKDGVNINTGAISHIEAKIAPWTKEFFKDKWIGEDGQPDFDKINAELPELFEVIGFRIPTEDTYSILPIKIVGFLSHNSGGAIALPAEITKLTGADFDIDKLYVMIKNLNRSGNTVEKYLDETVDVNTRRLSYANNLEEAYDIRKKYKGRLDEIYTAIKSIKHIYKSKDLVRQKLSFIDDLLTDVNRELNAIKNPTEKYINYVERVYSRNISNQEGLVEHIEYLKNKLDELITQQAILIGDIKQLNTEKEGILEDNETTNIFKKLKDVKEVMDKEILNLISEEDFNKIPIALQNTKQARDNRKLDIMWAALTHEKTSVSTLTPGGFDRLKDIANRIGSVTRPLISIFDAVSQDDITMQFKSGGPLKGIASNYNKHHSVRRHYDMGITKEVKFNGIIFKSLSSKDSAPDMKGQIYTITRNLSEILAAAVDNAKDPILAKLNYNRQTASLFSFLLSVGVDFDTVADFMNTKTIKDAVNLISLGDAYNLRDALYKMAKDVNLKITDDDVAVNYSRDQLKKNKNIVDVNLLKTAIIYNNMSEDLASLIQSSKSDTAGIGKVIEDGIELIENTEDLINRVEHNNFSITGVKEFLKGEKSFNGAFYKYGVEQPMSQIMDNIMPWRKPFMKDIRDMLLSDNSKRFSKEDRKSIDKHFIVYITSKFDFFKTIDDSTEADSLDLVAKIVPERYKQLLTKYPELSTNPLFNVLEYENADKNTNAKVLTFNNTATLSQEQRSEVKQAWRELIAPLKPYNPIEDSKEQELARFALDLIKYSFATTGLTFTPRGLVALVPEDVYIERTVNDEGIRLTDYLHEIINYNSDLITDDDVENFAIQYARHNFNNRKIFKEFEQSSVKSLGKGLIEVKQADSMFVRIGKKRYVATSDVMYTSPYSYSREYAEVTKLGIPGQFYEYDAYSDSDKKSRYARQVVNKTVPADSILEENVFSKMDPNMLASMGINVQDLNALPTNDNIEEKKDVCNFPKIKGL